MPSHSPYALSSLTFFVYAWSLNYLRIRDFFSSEIEVTLLEKPFPHFFWVCLFLSRLTTDKKRFSSILYSLSSFTLFSFQGAIYILISMYFFLSRLVGCGVLFFASLNFSWWEGRRSAGHTASHRASRERLSLAAALLPTFLLRKNIRFGLLRVCFATLLCKVAGGDEENRTPDPLLARQVLSQLSYTPV